MPVIGSRAIAGVRSFGLYVLAALSSVIDTFNRANNATDLGNINGQKWKIWRGAWEIVTNKASSSSAAGDNALATLKFTKTDVTVSVSGADPGMGVSFWVTDANNWYASVYTQNQVCQTCSNCNSFSGGNCAVTSPGFCNQNAVGTCSQGTFCCGTFNPSSCTGTFNPSFCISFTPGPCNQWNNTKPVGFCFGPSRVPQCTGGWNANTCNQFQPSTCNANCCPGPFNTWSPYCAGNVNAPSCSSFNPVVCNAFFTFSCNCVTEHRISIIRSLANTVSTISNNLLSAAVQSFRTILSGSQATIQAFSTTSYTSQIGNSITQNITTPQKTSQHGIIKSTSSFQQGSSIDEFGVS